VGTALLILDKSITFSTEPYNCKGERFILMTDVYS
jgi:hypothetical protein